MAHRVPVQDQRWRSFCEACGEPPEHAYDLKQARIDTTGEHIVLCWPCWHRVRNERPPGVSITARLEQLWRQRRRVPSR